MSPERNGKEKYVVLGINGPWIFSPTCKARAFWSKLLATGVNGWPNNNHASKVGDGAFFRRGL